jgi:hypothetical protein
MLGTPHLLGADVTPLGAILVTRSGRTATGDYQYVSRALGADVLPLVIASTYVSWVLGAVMPLRCNSRQYSLLDMNIVTGRVSI